MGLEPFSFVRSLRAVVTGSILAALLIGALLIALDRRERDQRSWVNHTAEVIGVLDAIHRVTLEGESAVRGYRINGNQENLIPYHEAVAQIEPLLQDLARLTTDNSAQAPAAAALTDLVHRKFVVIKEGLTAGMNVSRDPARPDSLSRGTVLMTEIRQALHDMERRERDLLTARQEAAATARAQTQAAIAFLFLTALGLAALAIRNAVVSKRKIEDSEARYRLLADNSTDIISLRNLVDDKMTYFSPAVKTLLGWETEDLLGDKWISFIHPDDRDSFLRERARYSKRGIHPSFQFRMRHQDGHYLWIDKRANVIGGNDDAPNLAISTWRDVTERKRAEDEAIELRRLAEDAKDEAVGLRHLAEDANRAKSNFLAMMSHELRTPMAGVLGIADLVLLGNLDDEQSRYIHQLRRSALSLLDILNDILDFSKIEAGKLDIDEHTFSLGDVMTDVRSLFAPVASKKGVIFEVEIAQAVPDGLTGDGNRLRQIIVNLANNAIKFTHHGRVGIRVEHQPDADGKVLLQVNVTDTGIGMAEDVIARLFEPFVQADGKVTRKFGGTGLGLAISRRLVAAMGGEITVESAPGEGSTFRISLPMGIAPDAFTSTRRQDRRSLVPRNLRPLSLLLAEDTDTIRLVVVTMLKKMGHSVVAVPDGAAAVREAQTQQFDAILMDMQMPVMDGVEATKAIRTFSTAPIIALTADAIPEHREIYIGVGVNGVVTKPINWDFLTTKLARFVPDVAVPAAAERRKIDPSEAIPPVLVNEKLLLELAETVGEPQFEKILVSFAHSMGKYRLELAEAIKEGDLKRVKKVAHALKGLSAQIGAAKLAAQALTLETGVNSLPEAAAELAILTMIADETMSAFAARRIAHE